MASYPAFNSWQARLAQQAAVGGLNPAQAKAAAAGGAYGEVEARYESDQRNRQLDMTQQQITNQAEQFGARLGQESERMAGQPMQSAISATGALGSVGLGAMAMKNAGLFGTKATQSTLPATGSTGALAGTSAAYTPEGLASGSNLAINQAGGVFNTAAPGEIAAASGAGVGAGEAAAAYSAGGIAEGSGIAANAAGGLYNTGVGSATVAADTAAAESLWGSIASYAGYVGEAAVAAWVLCSELVRQGGLDAKIVDEEWAYIQKIITHEEYMGYRVIADPLVKIMQKSKTFTWIIAPFIRAFAYEMASRVNKDIKGSVLGKAILSLGLPLCRICSPVVKKAEV